MKTLAHKLRRTGAYLKGVDECLDAGFDLEKLAEEAEALFMANARLSGERDRLRALVKQGESVVNDFMPNIGKCALQDYARLNEFLVEAAKVPAPSGIRSEE